jgi:hypothetical protein
MKEDSGRGPKEMKEKLWDGENRAADVISSLKRLIMSTL